ncbi:MAG TPA: DUF6256 family protein [Actinomycetota bacterium]
MLRQALPPLIAASVVFVAMVAIAARRPVRRPRLLARPPERASGREVLGTLAGGYVCFLAVVIVFHTWIGGEEDALRGALWGGAFLSAVAVGLAAVRSVAARSFADGRPSKRPRDGGE